MQTAPARSSSSDVQSSPRPFIKWVGGKRQLLTELLQHVPDRYGTYHEPFLGGGAVFFSLCPKRAVLADCNERLIRTYKGVRDDCERVIELLGSYPHDRDFYLDLRQQKIDLGSDAEIAAWLIYLNRTGYNGLYRVNRRNGYNVPFGDYRNPRICDAPNLRAASRALGRAELRGEDFAAIAKRARRGDFVYFDPPYVPMSATSSFTSYTSESFTLDDQIRLRDVAKALKRRGVHILISNSSSKVVRELYAGFDQRRVGANRAVNCKPEGRGKIKELLIW